MQHLHQNPYTSSPTVDAFWNNQPYSNTNSNNVSKTTSYVTDSYGNSSYTNIKVDADSESILDKVIGVVALGIFFGVGGALAAWAFTSISPISGAMMAATYAITFLTALTILDNLTNDDNIKMFGSIAAAIITTNLVVYAAFPYLGLAAVSWQSATVFSNLTVFGEGALALAILK